MKERPENCHGVEKVMRLSQAKMIKHISVKFHWYFENYRNVYTALSKPSKISKTGRSLRNELQV